MQTRRTRLRVTALVTVSIATLSIGLTGCASSDAASPATSMAAPAVAAPVARPDAPERVDAAAFAEVVAAPGVTVIDVRTPEEFASGHVEGAFNYDLAGADFSAQVGALDPAGTYAVYCRSGNRSQVAAAEMAQAGISGIYELESGIVGWQDAGLPVIQ